MRLEEGELVATGAELAVAPSVLDFLIGDLSRLPRVPSTHDDEEAVRVFFDEISDDFAAVNRAAIATLAKPSRIGVLHYSLGEESISRAILAWGPETGDQVVLMVSGEGAGWHIRVESVETLVNTVGSVLLEGDFLSPVDIRSTVTHEAALVFLAVQQLLAESRLHALLSHREPPLVFAVEAVEHVLDNSAAEDFRWPFFFLDKIMPFSANGVAWTEIIPSALKELADRELVEEMEGANGETWCLTESGYRVALCYHHHLTKVGIRVTELNEEGVKGHEAMLLMRSHHDLFLFNLAGSEAAIASMDFDGMRTLLTEFLTINPSPSELSPGTEDSMETLRSCPACAERIPADSTSCPVCGITISTSTEKSGKPQQGVTPPLPRKTEKPSPSRRKGPAQGKGKESDGEEVGAGEKKPVRHPKPPPLPPESGDAAEVESPTAPSVSEEARPQFCHACGERLNPGVKFCGGCGAEVPH